ncbi:butyrophilin subfamily 2 member A2-like [Echeneis naucrates]|uniref:butyrophilin subfamily 2 member A2-like n=1 Tax=Echeneis naucrates TaxID=173247 RepID=UPI001113B99D|nr:butyrophilin subfamily 2 member A2-like [Echeneis naucrates]
MDRTALFLIRTLLLAAAAGQNDVICPPQPIQTEEGETVSIRCRLNQTVDLQDEMISVRRQNLNEEVILYRDGKDHSEDNADSIRFSLNHEDLKGGILNLQISSVQLSDRGLYTVYIRGRKILFKVFLNVVKKVQRTIRTPTDPGPEKVDVPAVVGGVLGAAAVLVFIIIGVLWKCGRIKTCEMRLRGRRTEEPPRQQMIYREAEGLMNGVHTDGPHGGESGAAWGATGGTGTGHAAVTEE